MLPVCQQYDIGVIPWSPLAAGWLTGGYRVGRDLPTGLRAARLPDRFDLSVPGNQAKLEAADALGRLADESGMTLIQMAIAFVVQHPAVTAAIIGPRTHEHLESHLAALDVTLAADILDRIDEIVPPGTNFFANEQGYTPVAISEPSLRRR